MDIYGPPLPPGYVKPTDESEDSSISDAEMTTHSKVIGPQCPSFLSDASKDENEKYVSGTTSIASSMIGPELPPHLQSSQDCESDEMCGPTPAEFCEDFDSINDRKAEIEKRAEKMKNKLDNKDTPVKVSEREEWMTVPDTSRRNQLGAISRCLAPSHSSSKEKKSHSHRHSENDKRTSQELKKYNKSRRSESLMDMHSKKLKKEEKKNSKKKEERKAFDRDEMAVRSFTKEQVNSVIDKAKYLNSRFAAGNNQYL